MAVDSARIIACSPRDNQSTFSMSHDLLNSIPHLIWTARADGFREFFNQRWYDFTGSSESQSRGLGWLDYIHPDDRPKVVETRGATPPAISCNGAAPRPTFTTFISRRARPI
jgi:PAS domain-containing protein